MRILLAHNYYQQPGGEDAVVRAEKQLLEDRGHQVVLYERHNSEIESYSAISRLRLLKTAVWAGDSYDDMSDVVESARPDVAHFHNTFPLISPSAWRACRERGIPVVQTLNNYRWLCPNAQFFRNGRVCEDCLGKSVSWPGVLHACYRGSMLQSIAVASMIAAHRLLNTHRSSVDAYIALTEFARLKFVAAGYPTDRVHVKPNFLHADPGVGAGSGDYMLFVGRLSPEKGLFTMLEAWKELHDVRLLIAGDGPELAKARDLASRNNLECVEFLGRLPSDEIYRHLRSASALVFPSEWYEGFPITLLEAFACGVPVVGSRIGGVAEIVSETETGLLFTPGDPTDLARVVRGIRADPMARERMSELARAEFEKKYSAERNYEQLMHIYEIAQQNTGRDGAQ
jgi:glycosyltransferase involved in cell wall biosynthesis